FVVFRLLRTPVFHRANDRGSLGWEKSPSIPPPGLDFVLLRKLAQKWALGVNMRIIAFSKGGCRTRVPLFEKGCPELGRREGLGRFVRFTMETVLTVRRVMPGLIESLRAELTPAPGRWRRAVWMGLATMTAVLLAWSIQVPDFSAPVAAFFGLLP